MDEYIEHSDFLGEELSHPPKMEHDGARQNVRELLRRVGKLDWILYRKCLVNISELE